MEPVGGAARRSPAPAVLLRRALLVAIAGLLVTGLLAGLARLGVLVGWGPAYAAEHGPLVVVGVFASLVSLERAVALGRPLGYLAPLGALLSSFAMLLGVRGASAALALTTLPACAVNAAIVRRQSAAPTWLMLLASGILGAGAVAWAMSAPLLRVVPSWMAFFVLTIVAERLELSRLSPTPKSAQRLLIGLALALALAATAALARLPAATRAFGGIAACLGLWQLRFDIARRLVARGGLPRFSAVGVLSGAAWLVAAGVVLAALPLPAAGPVYDAALHAVFVGYVFSMIFAHAPIILPAVAAIDLPFTPALYAPLALLQGGLAARLAGDFAGSFELRRGGAVASVLALVLFALTVLAARARRGARRP